MVDFAPKRNYNELTPQTGPTFSETAKVSRSHYAQIETGDKDPSLKLSFRIKRALNYYGDDIFDDVVVAKQ